MTRAKHLPVRGLAEQPCGQRCVHMEGADCTQAIEAFQNDPPTTVFLLSMRSGSVGINLTSANYIFVLEPALNPALEEQAIGRAWRMGQQRQVTVKKLFVKVLFQSGLNRAVQSAVKGHFISNAGRKTCGIRIGYGSHVQSEQFTDFPPARAQHSNVPAWTMLPYLLRFTIVGTDDMLDLCM